MGLPTIEVNDEGIGHTAGTPVAGNVTLYRGVSWSVIDRQINATLERRCNLLDHNQRHPCPRK
jgi:hypothetical protein